MLCKWLFKFQRRLNKRTFTVAQLEKYWNYWKMIPTHTNVSLCLNLVFGRTFLINPATKKFGSNNNHLHEAWETVFHPDIQTPRRDCSRVFWQNLRCWDSQWNTVLSVWYIFSISKQKLRSKWVKLSKSMLIKTGYPNLLCDCDYLCFYLISYEWVWEVFSDLTFWHSQQTG